MVPTQEAGNKTNSHFDMYSTLSFKDISQSTLQDCTMTEETGNNIKPAPEGKKVGEVILMDLIEENRTSLSMLIWRKY